MSEQPHDPFIDPATGRPWTPWQRVKRGLTRRFPRTAHRFHWTRAHARRLAGAVWRRLLSVPRSLRWLASVARQIRRRRRQPGLTVAVDVSPLWHPLTGVGWYLYRVLQEMADDPDLTLRLYGPDIHTGPDVPAPVVPLPAGRAVERVIYDIPFDLSLSAGWIMGRMRWLAPLLIALDGNRVLFAPNYYLPRRFFLARGRRVATIHDLGLHRVPETLQEETREALARNLERSTARASRLIAVSAAVRDELVELGYAAAGDVDVVHHGPGQLAGVAPTRVPDGVTEPFALHVGTLEPRKNIVPLLAAWEHLHAGRGGDAPTLVLCGRYGWKSEAIRQAVDEAAAAGRALHLGYVDEGELAALYRAATMVVFPTRYEGFGLPAVEAQLAGAPLVCSDLPVLREVAGDGAVFVPAGDSEALAAAVAALLDDAPARRALADRGRRNAERLSWRRAADRTLAAWRRAAGLAEAGR